MDTANNTIIHSVTVDKREVMLQSPNMEREAVCRALTFIHAHDITIDELVTDASASIRKMLGMYTWSDCDH